MNKNKWTRNEKILLAGLIISMFTCAITFYSSYKTSNQQIIINQDLNEIKGKVGEFNKLISEDLFVNNINFTCPFGTEINYSVMTRDHIGVVCVNISGD